jgi:hypothetical protein
MQLCNWADGLANRNDAWHLSVRQGCTKSVSNWMAGQVADYMQLLWSQSMMVLSFERLDLC